MALVTLTQVEAASQDSLNYHLKHQVILREDYFDDELSLDFQLSLAAEVLRTYVESEDLRGYTITVDGATGVVAIEKDL